MVLRVVRILCRFNLFLMFFGVGSVPGDIQNSPDTPVIDGTGASCPLAL